MFYVRIITPNFHCGWKRWKGKVFEVKNIDQDSGAVTIKKMGSFPQIILEAKNYEIVTKKDFDECWKEPEKMVEINGKKYSESTILEALKQYVNN